MTDIATSRPPRDVSASGFLSKITRSPSRKHKTQPFSPLPRPERSPSTHSKRSHSGPSLTRTAPRPGFQRAPTAPVVSVGAASISSQPASSNSVQGDGDMFSTILPLSPPSASRSTDATRMQSAHPINTDMISITSLLPPPPNLSVGSQNLHSAYQHIQDISNKRIATLDYMRKTHEGRIHWFNTVHFSRADIAKMPTYTPGRLARRATNYFVIGLSIPAILEMHPQPHPQSSTSAFASAAQDYLKALNNLLSEFDTFQQFHPPDGSAASSLSRARLPQMFKRAPTIGKPRRTSGAAGTEIGLPMHPNTTSPTNEASQHSTQPSIDTTNYGSVPSNASLLAPSPASAMPTVNFPSSTSIPGSYSGDTHANSTLLTNEGPYTHLLAPPLPFVPDFFCVFATLCDVLIDAYQRLLQLINAPAVCNATVGDMFAKADAKIRKIMVGGIVKEFEGAAREGARKELMGVQRVVLGGLMGGL